MITYLNMDYAKACQNVKNSSKDNYFNLVCGISGQNTFSLPPEHTFYHSTIDSKISARKRVSFSPTSSDFFNLYIVNEEYDVFHVLPKSIVRYIDENKDTRFVLLPMIYTNSSLRKSHQNCCVIDTQMKEIFILEPNGVHPSVFVDKMMNMVVSEIKRHKPGYKFIPLQNWYSSGRSLNCWNDQDGLGSGICATICLFLAHKLVQLQGKEALHEYVKSLTKEKALGDIKEFISQM